MGGVLQPKKKKVRGTPSCGGLLSIGGRSGGGRERISLQKKNALTKQQEIWISRVENRKSIARHEVGKILPFFGGEELEGVSHRR